MNQHFSSQRGFHILEFLILLGIIGLVGVFAAIAVRAARSEQRDTVRLAQVRQIQLSLEDFFIVRNTYPNGERLALGVDQARCLSENGFVPSCSSESNVLASSIQPLPQSKSTGNLFCGNQRNGACYSIFQDGTNYGIEFELENDWKLIGLKKGINCAYPEGMKSGSCD